MTYNLETFDHYNPFDDRYHIIFHLLYTLDEPLSHKGDSTGNQGNLKTKLVPTLDGTPAPVFEYSANAGRNGYTGRRSVMKSFLDRVGFVVDQNHHRAFYCGGNIDGGTGNDMERESKIRRYIPPASLWGWAMPRGSFGGTDAGMMEGRLSWGAAHLLCYENAEYFYKEFPGILPHAVRDKIQLILEAKDRLYGDAILRSLRGEPITNAEDEAVYQAAQREWLPYLQEEMKSYVDLITFEQKIRFDSVNDPELARHLITADQPALDGKPGKPIKKKKGEKKDSAQMISGSWLIQRGAQLYSKVRSRHPITNIEEGALIDAWLEWSRSPYLGGMGSSGCGRASLQVYYQTEDGNADLYLDISSGTQKLSDRAETAVNKYHEFLKGARDNFSRYQEFIGGAKGSDELRQLVGGQ